jgi:hypothetical protein
MPRSFLQPGLRIKLHYLQPVTAGKGEGYLDKWIVYGKVVGFDNKLRLNCPKLRRFNELSNDEFFRT